MKGHLTERELIEYQFKLASDSRMGELAGHLEDCVQCRERLEQLKRKFTALDLLREEVEVSEDLISRVVEQAGSARGGVRTRLVSFRKPAWIGAAAAVLLVGFLLLASHLIEEQPQEHRFAKEPSAPAKITSTADSDKMLAMDKEHSVEVAKYGRRVIKGLMDGKKSEFLGVEISEQPPFAPASAIELVVLPRREKVQLTIYNSADLTLVRERRNLTLKKGWNWLQFMWANTLIDPTSLSLEPLKQADKIDIQQLVFPARLRELGRWLIRSEVSGQVPFEITYFTSGLSWRAFYMGTLSPDEKTMQMKGYVRVANASGEEYEKAQTRLIVGKVHLLDQIADLAKRQYAYGSPVSAPAKGVTYQWHRRTEEALVIVNGNFRDARALDLSNALGVMKPKEIKKEGLSEYFLYTIEGTETIPDKWGKRLLSFEAEDIEVESLYKYDEERWGGQTRRFVKFANDEEHNLGDTPIPDGQVRIYGQTDEDGSLSYVGGTSVKYIPVDEEVELNLGPARLVSVESVLMDFKTDNYVFDRKKNIAGWDEIRKWKIEITNTCELPIEIEITCGFGTAYWMLQHDDKDVSYEKHDATHARFKVNLEPRSKRPFRYTVRTYHGVREETLAKSKKN